MVKPQIKEAQCRIQRGYSEICVYIFHMFLDWSRLARTLISHLAISLEKSSWGQKDTMAYLLFSRHLQCALELSLTLLI